MDKLANQDLAFGLSGQILASLRQVFAQFPQVDKAVVCGSRQLEPIARIPISISPSWRPP
jgi:hypothetical protein